jgi:hypothetical protein
MKFLIVTAVADFREDIIQMFKEAQIDRFSGSEIEGYRNAGSFVLNPSWFMGHGQATESEMYFSFTDDDKIEVLFERLKEYNGRLETDNPVRAIVVPVEKFI